MEDPHKTIEEKTAIPSPSPDSVVTREADNHPDEATAEDRRRMKRGRDAAYGPATPKGESDESKLPGGLTPLAKKGRVQPTVGGIQPNGVDNSDSDSVPEDEDLEDDLNSGTRPTAIPNTPPRPARFSQNSTPATPVASCTESLEPPKTEGKDTRHIRRRVEALSTGPPNDADDAVNDVEIADVAAEVSESAQMLVKEDLVNEEFADVAADVAESARAIDPKPNDVEVAEVADEVAKTASKLGDDSHRDKAMEEANVAADVSTSAQMLAKLDEEKQERDEEIADVAAEVSQSAKIVDEEGARHAKLASEVSESAQEVEANKLKAGETTETSSKSSNEAAISIAPSDTVIPAKPTGFSAFSSTSSPFKGLETTASLISKPQGNIGENVDSVPQVLPKSLVTEDVTSPVSLTTEQPVPSTSAVPFSPEVKSLPANVYTPFSSFTPTTTSGSPFAAFSLSSPFRTLPSVGSGFGSYSAKSTTSSAFANIPSSFASQRGSADDEATSDAANDFPEVEEGKRVYQEQEVVTGEEEDETVHSTRAKLFAMVDGQWAERGAGLLKLNETRDGSRTGARLVMRADATHRLLLNATLFTKFVVEVTQDKYVRFAIIEGSEPISYMLRTSGSASAQVLTQAIRNRVATL